ncbi:M15 family metallopeptidase [Streptomyces catenulae]|uniref:M15 family metallopeptidase n=1 Tax=Streptomyces catenulae TaxID=66875 RepID=A0ABV2YX95_9ACTN|nr:M15 family metallopeptidase [Streptomyces catenulae]
MLGPVILLSAPRVSGIPVRDCGEPLAELAADPAVALSHRERDPAGAYGRARTGVLRRLRQASRSLPDGIGFLVVEGHRSAAEQARRSARHEDRLRRSGLADPAELRRRTSASVAPVEVAPHCAGAARAHRRLLACALRGAGFVNYPTEWWHWSYGDRY